MNDQRRPSRSRALGDDVITVDGERRDGTDPDAAPVMLGSHLDSVAAAGDLGYRHQPLRSGAGHELAHIGREAMIFVPGEHEGISHNPREYSSPDACRPGIDVLATVAARLAR